MLVEREMSGDDDENDDDDDDDDDEVDGAENYVSSLAWTGQWVLLMSCKLCPNYPQIFSK